MNKISLEFNIATAEEMTSTLIMFLHNNDQTSIQIAKMLNLNYIEWKTKPNDIQYQMVREKTEIIYKKIESKMLTGLKNLQIVWQQEQSKIEQSFKSAFGKFKDQKCLTSITFNYVIYPRYLKEKTFDIWYNFNKYEFLLTALNEITHFIWFDKLKSLMPKIKRNEYEYPSPVWLFSEIAVDQIFETQEYFKNIAKNSSQTPAYKRFYSDKIGDETIIEHFRKLFSNCNNIDEFIIKGTNDCIDLYSKNLIKS